MAFQINLFRLVMIGLLLPTAFGVLAAEAAPPIAETGVRGGLAVWIAQGEKPGQWAAALARLHEERGLLVLGLHNDAGTVAAVRDELAEAGRTGPVVVDVYLENLGLPLIDDSINLLVVSSGVSLAAEEIRRVLVPHGQALIAADGGYRKVTKPRPQAIDEWTHYLHSASNNAVARDERVGPPRHFQWQAGPRWSRHHDHMSSVSALVTSGGRVFTIVDEGSCLSPQFPADWQLVARDAFNGALLWKRSIARWHSHLWPLKSGPASLPRRLVAEGEKVYATLGIDAPVSVLDAASGETIGELAGTAGAEEILVQNGMVLALVNRTPADYEADAAVDPEESRSRDSRTTHSPLMGRLWSGIRSPRWSHGDRAVMAFDAAGRPVWKKSSKVIPLTLAADGEQVYFHNSERIVALALADGEEQWASEPAAVWEGLEGQGLQSWFAPTLVVYEGLVLFAGGEKTHMSYMGWGSPDIGQDTLAAFSAATGERLWTASSPYGGYNSPEDLFVAEGKVWTGNTAKGDDSGRYVAYDLASGELVRDFPPTLETHWFHHRCHRAKATEKYILCSRTGIELVDLASGEWTIHHWVRGACLYGIMPANGMIYSPQHPCACYPEAKLTGFAALAPARESPSVRHEEAFPRLQKGPAYDAPLSPPGGSPADAWPTYRGGPARSGAAASAVSAKLERQWSTPVGGRLSQPVAAAGKVFVADTEAHAIHAIDAKSGARLWSYQAGGRIDSPPTFDRGRLLFGEASGYVTCLEANDGRLAWRFRAAPSDLRMVSYDQVESVWPVHGSVLVTDGVATVVAGRSMFLDGGLRLYRLDVETGRVLGEKRVDDRSPEAEGDLQVHVKGLNMPVALTDILSTDGERLYMRSQVMDLEGNRLKLGPAGSGFPHLFAPYGFTDDSWFHRVYWVYGDGFQGGVGGFGTGKNIPAGRILACNDSTVFGYGRKPEYFRWSSVLDYQLFAADRPGGESGPPTGVSFETTESLDPAGRALTVAAWVKTDEPHGTILVRGANLNGFALTLAAGRPQMLLRTGGTTYVARARRAIASDWTHLAGVLGDDGRMEIYVDGRPAGSAEGVPRLSGTPSIGMKIGYDDTNQLLPDPLAPYRGALGEVMLFHRALSVDEIRALADPSSELSGEQLAEQVLHLRWTGGTPRDASPAGNHGRLEGRWKTVAGPRGDAFVFEQPRQLAASRHGASRPGVAYQWARDVPMMVRAMALAGNRLVVAGPPDLIDELATFETHQEPSSQSQLSRQDAAFRGESGGMLHVVDGATGETLADYSLDSPPVFDGLIIAGGRVLIATMDGRVVALGPGG